MNNLLRLCLVFMALWLTFEASMSKHSMENTATCSEVSWCAGNK